MPELPEVQTTIDRLIAAGLIGERIVSAEVGWPRTVGGDWRAFEAAIRGLVICTLTRRGKYLLFELQRAERADADGRTRPTDGAGVLWAICHLRMSGRLHLLDGAAPREGHERLVLLLESGRELRFVDPRKFGRFVMHRDPASVLDVLGPEPLADGFTGEVLAAALEGRRRALKPLLLDQTVIAGLGNIYVDEALFVAHLHPLRPAGSLSAEEVVALHAAIRRVLRTGIANLGASLGYGRTNFRLPDGGSGHNREALQVFRRTGRPCPDCGAPIQRIMVAQRSTHICPHCQPAGQE
ncbi:MAG: bifunctional DNA-formamidopyrimidine glycosylase/DNA-(apurinic or apyrimidinic site) lyase [Spirochaetaceae bacterium]|nr:MAG: bifunctional DNA-formamidopyrimidine glycosylase/DNA-(apurinic or apyrimidinic site) lyase [Spirochaetaceae bacterium]